MMKANYKLLFVFFAVVPARCFLLKNREPLLSKISKRDGISPSRITAAKTRDDADALPLSSFDRRKFHHMKTRGRVIPIIVLGEPILPGQRLYFRSGDPKFEELIKYIAQIERDNAESESSSPNTEIGILGFTPHGDQALHNGVTANVQSENFAYSLTAENRERAITTSFKGARMFRLAGDPWMDPTGSFHMAHVEILDGRFDDENYYAKQQDDQNKSDELFSQIPALVDEWMELMFEAGLTTPALLLTSQRELLSIKQQEYLEMESDLHHRLRHRNNNYALYPPRRQTERAIWVAALLNPIQRYPFPVSEEIRPEFLKCRSDRDRLDLCVKALRTSVGFLEVYVNSKKGEKPGT